MIVKYSLMALSVLLAAAASAQSLEKLPRTEALSWLGESFLAKQRSRADELARLNTGAKIRGNESDLITLQRLVDRDVVDSDNTEALQSLGVALGDVFVHAQDALEWRSYIDKLGRSHAVCVKKSTNCLFPVTMLSRRMEVGLKPDVAKIYDKAMSEIQPFLPKLPFQ